jgi:proton-coupled amino acid transporter
MMPANLILESYLFGDMPKSKKRQWSKNVLRAITVSITCLVAVVMRKTLDSFLAVVGALFCTPLAFILPCFIHFKGSAEGSKLYRIIDVVVIMIALVIMLFFTGLYIAEWKTEASNCS